MNAKTDVELLNYWGTRKQKRAFNVLYERYGHYVYGALFNYMKEASLTDELASSIWLQVWEGLPKDIKSFKSYLFFMCRNKAFAALKEAKKQVPFDADYMSGPTENPTETSSDQSEALKYCMTQLKPEQESCLKMFYYQSMSYKDIEEETHWTLNQIKSLIQNGKRMLKLCIAERSML